MLELLLEQLGAIHKLPWKVKKSRQFLSKSATFWSEWRDLNSRPHGPEPNIRYQMWSNLVKSIQK